MLAMKCNKILVVLNHKGLLSHFQHTFITLYEPLFEVKFSKNSTKTITILSTLDFYKVIVDLAFVSAIIISRQ